MEKTKKLKKTIAVDFDGVIHRYSKGYQGGSLYDDLMPGTKEALQRLADKGYKIIIYTARRGQVDEIYAWLKKKGLRRFVHYDHVTVYKPLAIAYIDDLGVRFTGNWEETLFSLFEHLKEKKNFNQIPPKEEREKIPRVEPIIEEEDEDKDLEEEGRFFMK